MTALRALTWVELKLFVREPLTVMFVLVLPLVVLYVLNGVFGSQADPSVWQGLPPIDFYTSAYVALVAATAGVLSLPVHLSGYREKGVLRRFRASAVRPWVLVGAHMTVTVVIATAGAVLLTVASVVAYDAALPRSWGGVVAAYLLTAVAFSGLGALLGFVVPTARAAQGLGVLLFFVFMMLGGAGPPKEVLPDALSRIASALPATQGADLIRAPWVGDDWDVRASVYLVALLVVSLGLTAWRLRTETER